MSERYVPITVPGNKLWPKSITSLMWFCTFPLPIFCLPLLCAVVQVTRRPNFKEMSQDYARCQRWLNKKRFKAFYTSVFADNLRHGTQFLLQVGTSDCTHIIFFSVCSDHLIRPFKVLSSFLRRLVWVVWSQTRWSWVSRTTGGMGTWGMWRFISTQYSTWH